MTTSDLYGGYPPPPPPPAPPSSERRVLRRNRSNRVAAGVSSGLGDYFSVDPVLFRVLFATSAFFGGAGILAYLLAWAAIPESGTERAPIDGWIAALRRRRVPLWVVAIAAGLFLWVVAFSWWAPGPFFPVMAVVVLLVVFFGRRELQSPSPNPAAPPTIPAPVDLAKREATAPSADQPTWVRDARAWLDESRAASRQRRRRAMPIRVGVLTTLAVTLIGLGIADALTGVAFQWYFWATLAIVGTGLLLGLVTRRFPASLISLLPPAIIGAIAFGGSHASLHDGIGQKDWRPTTTASTHYKLAFGQGVLDLRAVPTASTPLRIDVTMGAGQVKIIAPRSMNLTVESNIHIGQLQIDGNDSGHGGIGLSRTVDPPAGATGAPVTVDVHLADGNVSVVRK
jgi:phage shock protein PspC (stress-responsive transcriptional regulator)